MLPSVCRKRALWVPKPGEKVYYAPVDIWTPKVLELYVCGTTDGKLLTCNGHPNDPFIWVRHYEDDNRLTVLNREVLFQTPLEALMWQKYQFLRAAENVDFAIVELLNTGTKACM